MCRRLTLGLSLLVLALLSGCTGQPALPHSPPPAQPSQPAAAPTVYVLGSSLAAFRDGRERWREPLPLSPLRSALAVAAGVVYAGDDTLLLAVDAASGRLRWRAAVAPGIQQLQVVGALIYAGAGALLYAFDRRGTLRWQQQLSPAGLTAPLVSERHVLYLGTTGRLLALDAATGRALWQRANPGWGDVQSLLLAGRIVLARIAGGGVVAVDRSTGTLLWQRREPVLALALSPDQRLLYTVALDVLPAHTGLRALRVADGATVWEVATPVAQGEHTVITAQAFYRATGPQLAALSAWSTRDGRPLWRRENGSPITALLADADTLYTVSATGLTARQGTTGALRWQDADLMAPAALMEQDGTLYWLGQDGLIAALSVAQGSRLYQMQAGFFTQVVVN